jgi:alkanesulfonate monooxygenase SsuD/methylene tetrahydromethanopterin reductase-like flavin-dependent oxidoreductase (luciferase family)
MKFAVNLPNFGYFGDARAIAELAREAEQVGWDGFFLWDHILFDDLWHPLVDPWVALTAVATHTTTIRIGTMITPDAQVRAQKLDEGLDILTGLWSGEYFSYVGEHYQLEEMRFLPTPVQTPRIPIWVGGYWPRKRPFRRAARFDGLCPGKIEGQLTPDDWRDVLTYIHQHRQSDTPFAAVGGGVTPGDNPAKAMDIVASFAEAGVNWWVEDISPYGRGLRWDEKWGADTAVRLRERIQQGPPKL